jgi:hypothetical protein
MYRFILITGTIIGSSLGFALAGLTLGEAIRNSRRRAAPKRIYKRHFLVDENVLRSAFRDPISRGYDSPEVLREDSLARTKNSGNDRDYQ